jgi:hypothetical protein
MVTKTREGEMANTGGKGFVDYILQTMEMFVDAVSYIVPCDVIPVSKRRVTDPTYSILHCMV